MAVSNPGQPDPQVRALLQQLVMSQRRTDRWMLTLTGLIAVVAIVTLAVAIIR